VYGSNGVTIFDLSESVKYQSKYFQLKNVKVHYLTEGDSYNLLTKAVFSTKPPILVPQYKEGIDSNDILGEYDGSLLLTRLVDQIPISNRGLSKVPDGFPQNSPIFEIIFRRSAQTKGYKLEDKYTVVNAYLDYAYLWLSIFFIIFS